MDLAKARKELAEKSAVLTRIRTELNGVRDSLAQAAQATRDAQARAKELQIAAVIEPAKKAEAEKASATIADLYEAETALRDRVPILDNAAGIVQQEVHALQTAISRTENELLTSASKELRERAIERLRDAAAEVLMCRYQGGPIGGVPDNGEFWADYVPRSELLDRALAKRAELVKRVLGGEIAP